MKTSGLLVVLLLALGCNRSGPTPAPAPDIRPNSLAAPKPAPPKIDPHVGVWERYFADKTHLPDTDSPSIVPPQEYTDARDNCRLPRKRYWYSFTYKGPDGKVERLHSIWYPADRDSAALMKKYGLYFQPNPKVNPRDGCIDLFEREGGCGVKLDENNRMHVDEGKPLIIPLDPKELNHLF